MREIKTIYHTSEERKEANSLINSYQKQSSMLTEEYIKLSRPLLDKQQSGTITWEEYRAIQLPQFKEYKDKENKLYKAFTEKCRELGYEAGDE